MQSMPASTFDIIARLTCRRVNMDVSAKHVVLSGTRVLLVPYAKEHVEAYHEWMKDEYLLGKEAPKA